MKKKSSKYCLEFFFCNGIRNNIKYFSVALGNKNTINYLVICLCFIVYDND